MPKRVLVKDYIPKPDERGVTRHHIVKVKRLNKPNVEGIIAQSSDEGIQIHDQITRKHTFVLYEELDTVEDLGSDEVVYPPYPENPEGEGGGAGIKNK